MSGTAISVGLRPGRLWQQYCTALEQTPLRMKAATAATGFALGDLVAQLATRTPGETFRFDVLRTARLAVYGGEQLLLLRRPCLTVGAASDPCATAATLTRSTGLQALLAGP